MLGAAGIARPEGAHLAVGPLLPGNPLHHVVAILRIVGNQPPGPLAGITAPDVVGDHDIPALGVVVALGLARVLVIGSPGQDGWEPAGYRLAVPRGPIEV